MQFSERYSQAVKNCVGSRAVTIERFGDLAGTLGDDASGFSFST
jgi:hypothetical protein